MICFFKIRIGTSNLSKAEEIFDRSFGAISVVQGTLKMNGAISEVNKNVFLNLHGHNVSCQRRELSIFYMSYQQCASHAYCGAEEPVSKMASHKEKAFCVFSFEVSRSL
jgi:hypothetical protein